jgi:hypothetical protein
MNFKVRFFAFDKNNAVSTDQAAAMEVFIAAEQALDGGGWDLFETIHGNADGMYFIFSRP